MRLANKVALITGGGSGLGRASAIMFAQEGAKVVIAQRTAATAEETVAAIKQKGGDAFSVPTDVTLSADVQRVIKATLDKYGKIDILYNNAGMEHMRTPVQDIDEALWDRIFTVNVKGYFLMVKYAIPVMLKAGGGVIINTASTLAIRPRAGLGAYITSKGAVITFTKLLATELAPTIRANCICPMAIDTPMQRRLSAKIGFEKFAQEVAGRTPLGRMATPEEVADTAVFLASDESKMLTGAVISVDGGSAM
ncbi:MAG: SDR family oxidoreductase [Chloroflexi bacterium]|nr:SDR family oxidoreductase [Chloroflexota bacterium]